MDAVREPLVVSVMLVVGVALWAPVQSDASPQEPTPAADASQFAAESADADQWDWPEPEEFQRQIRRHFEDVSPTRVVVGDVVFEPADQPGEESCPDESYRFEDALLAVQHHGEDAAFHAILASQPEDTRTFAGLLHQRELPFERRDDPPEAAGRRVAHPGETLHRAQRRASRVTARQAPRAHRWSAAGPVTPGYAVVSRGASMSSPYRCSHSVITTR